MTKRAPERPAPRPSAPAAGGPRLASPRAPAPARLTTSPPSSPRARPPPAPRGATELAGAEPALITNAVARDDDVAVPSMAALGQGGSASSVDALAGVALDGDRSDEARAAAAHALAGLFGRGLRPGADVTLGLEALLASDAALEVRAAAAHALGALGSGGEILGGVSSAPTE